MPSAQNYLAPIRMKVCGRLALSDNFEWTPQELLGMIKEIDRNDKIIKEIENKK
jgi:hypothetical protein